MQECIGVLSKNDRDARHILMWDYDGAINPGMMDFLKEFVQRHGLDLWIFVTDRGFHFVDVHLFYCYELDIIQGELQKIFPSDYPTIEQVKKEDYYQGVDFKGSTLRIDPAPKFFMQLSAESQERQISEGHSLLYQLIAKQKLFPKGEKVPTSLSFVGYMRKNHARPTIQ